MSINPTPNSKGAQGDSKRAHARKEKRGYEYLRGQSPSLKNDLPEMDHTTLIECVQSTGVTGYETEEIEDFV